MEHARPPAITFAELRDMGVRGLLGYCADLQPLDRHQWRWLAR